MAAPPFVRLRELEAASQALEHEHLAPDAPGIDAWLRMLIAPGGSLGGARPKAGVADAQGHLWIAKLPSVKDEHDVGAWELVVHALALVCGLRVAPARAQRLGSRYHAFMVRRFDRGERGERLHFASALTLTGRQDGDDAASGASYLELARVLMEQGAQPAADLKELWSRIVLNMLVSNTDDHLRNHGFLLVPRNGWRLCGGGCWRPVWGWASGRWRRWRRRLAWSGDPSAGFSGQRDGAQRLLEHDRVRQHRVVPQNLAMCVSRPRIDGVPETDRS